jgi:hypothetical protein
VKLGRWLSNPIVIAALVEFVIIAGIVILVFKRT